MIPFPPFNVSQQLAMEVGTASRAVRFDLSSRLGTRTDELRPPSLYSLLICLCENLSENRSSTENFEITAGLRAVFLNMYSRRSLASHLRDVSIP